MKSHKVGVREYNDKRFPHLKYVVNYYEGEGGARRRRRKFFERKDNANAFSDEQRIKRHNEDVLGELPADDYLMARKCKEALSVFGKTIGDATDFFLAYLKAAEKSCTAVQLVKELLDAKERDGASARHVRDLRSRLNIFAGKFDGQAVSTITSAAIDDWLRALPFSAVTRNHYRRLIVLAFNFAVQRGYATSNPAKQTAKAKERPRDIGILTVTQAARLLESAAPDVLPYIAIGLFGGLRRAEIERLDWSEINFEDGLIEVKAEKSKTAQRRFVTLQPNLREWLLPVRKHRGPVTSDDFRNRFDAVRIAAGFVRWPYNALRHSFASYHLSAFKNAATTALELGHHDSRITFRHYRELVKPKDAERYWSIRPVESSSIVAYKNLS